MSNGYNVVTNQWADLATEWEHKLTTAQVNQTTGLTNARVTKWAPEVSFQSSLHAFPSSTDIPILLLLSAY